MNIGGWIFMLFVPRPRLGHDHLGLLAAPETRLVRSRTTNVPLLKGKLSLPGTRLGRELALAPYCYARNPIRPILRALRGRAPRCCADQSALAAPRARIPSPSRALSFEPSRSNAPAKITSCSALASTANPRCSVSIPARR